MSGNALLKELAAARVARRGDPALGEPAAAPAPGARPAQAPARTTREIISIDSDEDAAPASAAPTTREGVIEIHSDSDDDAPAARRVTTDAIDLTRDSDDEGPRKRQRTARPPRPPPPQRPRIQVIRNYGGVQGLVVAPRFLSEAAERRLFESMGTRCPLPTGQVETGFGRSDLTAAPRGRYDRFSPDLWRCINGIRDHVYPELLLPDFALFWSYRQKRKRGGGLVSNGNAFNVHYDSKITYGETVAGVSVGRASLLVMELCPCPHDIRPSKYKPHCTCTSAVKRRVEVPLPRGSVYVMSGDSRDQADRSRAWKHGIKWPTQLDPAPPWNPTGERRSVTLRANKPWSHYCLEHRVREGLGPTPGDVAARLRLQRSILTSKGKFFSKDGTDQRPDPARLAADLRAGAVPYQLRFGAADFAA